MSEAQPSPTSNLASSLAPGKLVGARFLVEAVRGTDALGVLADARDQKTKKAVALRVLPSTLFTTPAAAEVLRSEIRLATTTTHKHLAAVFGTGTDQGGRFVASEGIGASLAELVQTKRHEGDPIPLRDACAMVAQLCDALAPLHARQSAHGAVRPAAVGVGADGVKLGEVGLARAVVRTVGASGLGEDAVPFIAPELRGGPSEPTVASDLFGLGSVLYGVLCLRSPAEDFVAPSFAHPEGNKELDAILLKCLAPSPAERFATAQELRAALAPFVSPAGISGGVAAVDVDVDVDVDIPLSVAPVAASDMVVPTIPKAPAVPKIDVAPVPRPPGPPPSAGGAPLPGQRIARDAAFRPSAISLVPDEAPAPSQQVDLGTLLKRITENDAPRWMAQKDGLDHGPFSGRELVELLTKGGVRGTNQLMNMDTGERKPVAEWLEFKEFAEQYDLKAAAEAERSAIQSSAKAESKGNVAKSIVAGAVVVSVIGLAIAFLATRGAEQDEQVASAELADLFERGDVQIEGAAGILPDPPATQRRGGGGARRAGGGGGGGGTSYEDAMSQAVDIGDATRAGGEGRLSPGQVAGVMNGQINSMFSCVSQELRAGHGLGRVRIDVAIAGSGSVLGSSVRAGSPEFQRCIQGRVAAIHFPSFGAPRMGASYTFDASQ